MARRTAWMERAKAENERLNAMRGHVEAWGPLSSDHTDLKKFMLEQINTSMNDLTHDETAIRELLDRPALSFFEADIQNTRRDIAYHTECDIKERKSVDSQNEWVRLLRESLPSNQPCGQS